MGCASSVIPCKGCKGRVQPEGSKDQVHGVGRRVQPNYRRDLPSNIILDPDIKTVQAVVEVDLKIPLNAKAHHTQAYDVCKHKITPKLVVRRGQEFMIDIQLSRDYDENSDILRFVFEAGEKPLESKGTHVEFLLSSDDKSSKWEATLVSKQEKSITVNVTTPPSCLVGKWRLHLDVIKSEEHKVNIYRYQYKQPIYVIFNPWCKDDLVYMNDQNLLKEYILNENGQIYSGNKTTITSKPWNFAQFESCVLDVAMYLLDKSGLNWAVRGNPIPVVRKLSALINSSDDDGVLMGNWSGDYTGGRSPLSWTGSAAILEEYWKTKESVKYGQCWVFSGLATTICRTLGIPARSVTNFASAHDTDGSITIDVHFNADGTSDKAADDDSIWNFHVWNEAWMARPDLPSGYGGWQAFDATPQEASDDVYCCGPTSVAAIKQGEVNLPYDGPFVFAEVNADRMYWAPNSLGKLECVYLDKKAIGKNISTKAPNSDEREDITLEYKQEEGSAAERAAVLRANQVGSNRKDIYVQKANDIDFNVEQDQENTHIGGKFELSLKMKNRGSEPRTVSGRIEIRSMYYTGVVADLVKSDPFDGVEIKPGEELKHTVIATQEDYSRKLKDCAMLDVTIWAVVKETDQHFTKKDDYRLRKPHLVIKAPEDAVVNKELKVEVSFVNPLNSALTKCFLAVDGVGQSLKISQGNVSANSTYTGSISITPTKVGKADLIIIFNSLELDDINGTHHMTLKKA
ncbi:annulin-like [Physella acuta]|uniref:annulin-like n=1 Tax=Physella acuta TaxID=109671 RepID=UPI0027DB9B35|nr:annulin-like [Physella acuta]XP_059152312.1 annulin-like [Physella acuta]XP_059152313.1 annulin-like [Physella acuta]